MTGTGGQDATVQDIRSRELFATALGNLIISTPILPDDPFTCNRLYYLLQTAAVVKPLKAKLSIRTILFDELFVQRYGAATDLQCLLLAVTAQYGVDEGLVNFIHVSVLRHPYFEYLLTAFRVLFRGCESGEEALRLLIKLVQAAVDDSHLKQLSSQFSLFLARHDTGEFERWIDRSLKSDDGGTLSKTLHTLRPCLAKHFAHAPIHVLIRSPKVVTEAFAEAGAKEFLDFVSKRKSEGLAFILLLADLSRYGLSWKIYDPLQVIRHAADFDPVLTVNNVSVSLDRSSYRAELDILLRAYDCLTLVPEIYERIDG
jgi:hypothetical protein